MNPHTGAIYESLEAARLAGELEENLVELSGSPKAVKRAARSIQEQARAKAKRKAQKAARKRNRG